jgi:hypothetical protein
MAPPPGRKGSSIPGMNAFENLKPGEKVYILVLPDGSTAYRPMTQEYADALKARGVKVDPVEYQ